MKLVYWCCPIGNDHPSYNIRTKTKKEALQLRQELGKDNFALPEKVEITYSDVITTRTRPKATKS